MKVQPNSQLTLQAIPEFKQYLSYMKSEMIGILRIKAPELEEDEEKEKRPPADVVCAIDLSGSMSGEKLKLLKHTMKFMIDQLEDQDRLGITTYSDGLGQCLPLTNLNKEGKETAHKFCESMSAGGMTNLSAGLFEAVRMLESRSEKSDVSSILLMTDGIVNRGVTSSETIVEILKGKRAAPQQQRRISLPQKDYSAEYSVNSFGYGHGHSVEWLKAISDNCSGMYFDIKNPDACGEAFVNCLGGLLSTVCSKLRITLETGSPSVTFKKIHTSFECKEVVKGKKFEIKMHDLQSEEVKDIVFELDMAKLEKADDEFKYIKASITYLDHMIEKECTKNIAGIVERLDQIEKQEANKEVDEQRNRIEAQRAMEEAIALSKKGDYEQGRARISRAMKEIEKSKSAQESKAYMDDLFEAEEQMTSSRWSQGGHAYAQNVNHGWGQQRSNAFSKKSGMKLANKKRKKMLAKFKSSA